MSIKLKTKATAVEFEGKDEKEALMLYEALGKEICKKYGFSYSRLLEVMVRREEKRKD
ncbi:hypothetical protein [Cetobacterium somerae]|uniref:hypothetical protein n=1 Tax=Cetobacterium somerae TaxID=188913 RepID=UPI00389173AE